VRTETENYGLQRDHAPRLARPGLAGGSMSPADERAWSAAAHLSTFLNIFTGFLGPVAALVIWLFFRDSSPTVAAHALRSALYQVVWLSAIVVGWAVTGLLMLVLVGFLLVPVMALVTLAPFVQASFEAYRAYRGTGRGRYC
jgi:uncharacterized protein